MSSAEEFGKSIEELREQIAELIAVAEERKKALETVLTKLGDFAFPDRDVNGGDLVDTCSQLYEDLLGNSALAMDLTPRVMRLDDGTFRKSNMDIVDDIEEAGAFFGGQALEPNETLVDLSVALGEMSPERQTRQ